MDNPMLEIDEPTSTKDKNIFVIELLGCVCKSYKLCILVELS